MQAAVLHKPVRNLLGKGEQAGHGSVTMSQINAEKGKIAAEASATPFESKSIAGRKLTKRALTAQDPWQRAPSWNALRKQ
jgi:3-dehydroquinate dehydratase